MIVKFCVARTDLQTNRLLNFNSNECMHASNGTLDAMRFNQSNGREIINGNIIISFSST